MNCGYRKWGPPTTGTSTLRRGKRKKGKKEKKKRKRKTVIITESISGLWRSHFASQPLIRWEDDVKTPKTPHAIFPNEHLYRLRDYTPTPINPPFGIAITQNGLRSRTSKCFFLPRPTNYSSSHTLFSPGGPIDTRHRILAYPWSFTHHPNARLDLKIMAVWITYRDVPRMIFTNRIWTI